MAVAAVIGAGFAGHTAALYLRRELGREHDVVVINKHDYFLYLPSLVWVGVGRMKPEKCRIGLERVYERKGVRFVQGEAHTVRPDGNHVLVRTPGGEDVRVDYDYLIIATGPKLDWEATPGLGPYHGASHSICWLGSAAQSRDAYLEQIDRLSAGDKVRFVIGAGHGEATCQGAAFEYIANLHMDLVRRGLRDKAEVVWLSNEPVLGDFGIGGLRARSRKGVLRSEDFIRDLFEDCGIECRIARAVTGLDHGAAYWEALDGREGETRFDFAMLIPRFTGSPMRFEDDDGNDVSDKVVNDKGFVIVDGYYGLPYDVLSATPEAWPATYRNPNYGGIFAAGISFATPGPITRPAVTPGGRPIAPAAPRTGMVSGAIGRLVATNIAGLVNEGRMTHQERMTEMFSACIASMSDSLVNGAACAITVYPTVPDPVRYKSGGGREAFTTHMGVGLSGAWLKRMLHTMMLYKARALPGWRFIPE